MPLPPRRLAAVLVALASLASPALAQEPAAPNPNDVKAVAVHPARVALERTVVHSSSCSAAATARGPTSSRSWSTTRR